MNNAIIYVAPKNNTMEHITSLKNRIYCMEGIFIFWFNKYRHKLFSLMEINMIPTFKQFLQSETVNADKTKHNINDTM